MMKLSVLLSTASSRHVVLTVLSLLLAHDASLPPMHRAPQPRLRLRLQSEREQWLL